MHCFLWLGSAWNQPAASAMAAPLALAEHLGAPIQQLPALEIQGSSGFCHQLWVLQFWCCNEAAPYLDVLRSHFLGIGFPPRFAYLLKIKEQMILDPRSNTEAVSLFNILAPRSALELT